MTDPTSTERRAALQAEADKYTADVLAQLGSTDPDEKLTRADSYAYEAKQCALVSHMLAGNGPTAYLKVAMDGRNVLAAWIDYMNFDGHAMVPLDPETGRRMLVALVQDD